MRITAPMKAAAQRLTLPFLIFVSALLIVFGKTDTFLYDGMRAALTDRVAPVLQVMRQPMVAVTSAFQAVSDVVAAHRENAELREENGRLMQWQEVARRLAAENAELRDLVKLVPESAVHSIAARVIADSGGAFARNVLIDVGQKDGVQRGQAAMTGEGLVGRVAEVGDRTARVLLMTDLNSHIPVELEETHERAILDGDNSEEPRLIYLPPKTEVKVGARIVTGGAGGVFPPGLPVGVVSSIAGDMIRVEPYAELARLELLRIVDFGLSGVLPQSAVPAPRAARGRSGAAAR
ncbi:MAG: rod shape-determining protein MreC [Stellaceae bacterium]